MTALHEALLTTIKSQLTARGWTSRRHPIFKGLAVKTFDTAAGQRDAVVYAYTTTSGIKLDASYTSEGRNVLETVYMAPVGIDWDPEHVKVNVDRFHDEIIRVVNQSFARRLFLTAQATA